MKAERPSETHIVQKRKMIRAVDLKTLRKTEDILVTV
jgi:hypothetical protein